MGNEDTKKRLLEAAGGIFARDGFAGATVRDICAAAEANVAAVNYHFGDKAGLYRAVFDYSFDCSCGKLAPPPDPTLPAEERLRIWVTGFLHRILDRGKPAWHGQLMAREMNEPTAVLDAVVENHIRPNMQQLDAIVRDLLPAKTPAAVLRRVSASTVGQCVFYHYCRPIFSRLHPEWKPTPDEVEAIAEHVTRFCLAGIRASASEARQPARR